MVVERTAECAEQRIASADERAPAYKGSGHQQAPSRGESAHYVECGGEQLYYVTHEPSQPIKGRVLLLGPMPSERHYAYASWVEWARFLANRGLAVLRFDYRASGESTGAFADTDCQAWLEDACALIPRIPGAETPLTLCGLRLGGLLGARLLEDGQAKRLLAWAPPKGGREHMMEHLRRRLAEDMAMELPAPRKTRQDYIAELEEGQGLQVDGYIWTKRFWDSCLDLAAPRQVPGTSQLVHTTHTERDLQTMTTAEWKVQIPRPAFWFEGPWFRPELGSLFSASADWIMARTTDQEVRA